MKDISSILLFNPCCCTSRWMHSQLAQRTLILPWKKGIMSWELSLTNGNLAVQPIPRTFILHRDKWAISTPLECNTHASALFRYCLDVGQAYIPLSLELLGAHKHYTVVCQHDQHVSAGKFQMRNIILAEVLAVVRCFEPELTQCLSLRIWSHNAVCCNEARETNTV